MFIACCTLVTLLNAVVNSQPAQNGSIFIACCTLSAKELSPPMGGMENPFQVLARMMHGAITSRSRLTAWYINNANKRERGPPDSEEQEKQEEHKRAATMLQRSWNAGVLALRLGVVGRCTAAVECYG